MDSHHKEPVMPSFVDPMIWDTSGLFYKEVNPSLAKPPLYFNGG